MEKQGADAPGVLTLTTSLSTVSSASSIGVYFLYKTSLMLIDNSVLVI